MSPYFHHDLDDPQTANPAHRPSPHQSSAHSRIPSIQST